MAKKFARLAPTPGQTTTNVANQYPTTPSVSLTRVSRRGNHRDTTLPPGDTEGMDLFNLVALSLPNPTDEEWTDKEDSVVANQSVRTLEQLQRKVDRLALLTHGMWELVRERTGLTAEDLCKKCDEIDLRDGKRDGRVQPPPTTCSACNRKTSTRFGHCMTCGAKLTGIEPFNSEGS